jgi:hypothetical protein
MTVISRKHQYLENINFHFKGSTSDSPLPVRQGIQRQFVLHGVELSLPQLRVARAIVGIIF